MSTLVGEVSERGNSDEFLWKLFGGYSLGTDTSPVEVLFDAASDIFLLLAHAASAWTPFPPENPDIEFPVFQFPGKSRLQKHRKTSYESILEEIQEEKKSEHFSEDVSSWNRYRENLIDALGNELTRRVESHMRFSLTSDAKNLFYALASAFVKLRAGVAFRNAFAAFLQQTQSSGQIQPETPKASKKRRCTANRVKEHNRRGYYRRKRKDRSV